ncbi:glycosyltransferase [Bacillus sp. AFS055030]|uniref:glycosyltransferase n=1 Tax=Bacillus sp. AFS055030 TaxID=2033507 RepID=UPI000BFB237C|nr:glycosyltransferase [Bacillus sp. AFS055030]PGL70333.1 glycosyl transferase [Bacillus sp. AFS055030]
MKKNILFIMSNLNCGGAEKALISLLETMNYKDYSVDLLLFKHEGIFYSKVPNQVNIINEMPEYRYFEMPLKKAIKECFKLGKYKLAFSRIKAGFIFKTEKNRVRCDQRVWKYLSNAFIPLNKQYDVAIGYLENNPVYFCIDKVIARKKIGFIHNDYDKLGMNPEIDKYYFEKLDNIVTVSTECGNVLKKRFPMYKNKVKVMHNIVSPKMINEMSNEEIELNFKGITLVSIGRLNNQKGFDMAIEACKNLIESGYKVKWYIIGEGEERKKLEKLIEEHKLHDSFILLGIKTNPYPYIRNADIYIQPSRFEGKSIAIDEAKILRKPIVVTNFSTVKDQIRNYENGIIVKMEAISISDGIKKLIDDANLRNKLINNLSNERLGTESEIEKLYVMLEDRKESVNVI